jgi:DNA-binding NtrC family response regulator
MLVRKFGCPGHEFGISAPALRLLEEYSWPGSVRELENVIERAVVLSRGDVIGTELLDLRTPGVPDAAKVPRVRLDDALDRLEREMILRALEETKQVKARAARVLAISERSLWYKLRKHGLT